MKIFFLLLISSFIFLSSVHSQNNALYFDGSNDYVAINSVCGITGGLSVELWFKTTTTTSTCLFGQSKTPPTATPTSFVPSISILSTGYVRAEYWTGTLGAITSTSTYNDGKWHHVAFTASMTSQVLYIDGVQIGTRTGNLLQNWWFYTQIGTGYDAGTRFNAGSGWKYVNATIDEVRVWDTILTLSMIKDWSYRPLTSSHPYYSALAAYYKFDETTGTTAHDSSSNNYNGTLTNFTGTPWQTSYVPFISTPSNYKFNIAATWPAKSSSSSSIMTISDVMSGNSYIVYGHNNNPLNYNASDKPSFMMKRLSRSWRIEKAGSLTGDITFDYSGIDTTGFNTFKLLVSSDSSFVNASYINGVKIWGQKILFNNVVFQDSFFYTLGAYDFQGPTVETYAIENIKAFSATIKGHVLDDGGLSTSRGICYGTSPNPDITGNKISSGTGTGIYSIPLSNLMANTTYHVRAYAFNTMDTVYGGDSIFTTPNPSAALVTTDGLVTIYTDSAEVSGSVVNDGNVLVTERGICYSINQNPTADLTTKIIKGSGKGSFTVFISNLTPNTSYHYRAYAINAIDTAYGADSVFTTLAVSVPTVTTGVISNITGYSAKVTGDCSFDGRRAVTAKGIVWGTSPNPTVALTTKTNVGGNIGNIVSNLTNLQPNTTYYVRAYATNSIGTGYGSETAFLTAAPPDVQVVGITSISYYSATVKMNVSSDGRMPVTSKGICYGKTINPDFSDTKVSLGNGVGSANAVLNNLPPGTVYHVRAFAINAVDTAFSADSSFKTKTTYPPDVTTKTVTNILATKANCGGIVNSDGGTTVTERGICWSTTANPKANLSTKIAVGFGVGSFSAPINNLSYGTTYHVRAYAINNVDTAYGGDTVFTTIGAPTVTTDTISNIGVNSATCGGTVTSDGGSFVTQRGLCWSTSPNPTARLITKANNGFGTGHYTITISGLKTNSKYYVRAYAINVADTSYGNEVSFATPVTPEVKTNSISQITGYAAKVEGNVVSGSNVTSRGIIWSKYPNPSIGLATKTDEGGGLGTFSSNISGLESNTIYHVRAYATNNAGTSYGADSSFLTATLPSLTTENVTITGASSAECGGNISSNGRMPVTSRGVCWSENPSPTAHLSTKTSDGTGIGKYISSVSGLKANTTYYIRAYAINEVDTAYGDEKTFEINPPIVYTGSAQNIDLASVDLSGIVNAKGQMTSVYFEYGKTTSYGNNVAGTPNNINTSIDENISATIISLESSTTYHYRLVAESSHGTTYGNDSTFTTLTNSINDKQIDNQIYVYVENGELIIKLIEPSNNDYEIRILDMMGHIIYNGKLNKEIHYQIKEASAYYLVQVIGKGEIGVKRVFVD